MLYIIWIEKQHLTNAQLSVIEKIDHEIQSKIEVLRIVLLMT
jgi:hypothetical protein